MYSKDPLFIGFRLKVLDFISVSSVLSNFNFNRFLDLQRLFLGILVLYPLRKVAYTTFGPFRSEDYVSYQLRSCWWQGTSINLKNYPKTWYAIYTVFFLFRPLPLMAPVPLFWIAARTKIFLRLRIFFSMFTECLFLGLQNFNVALWLAWRKKVFMEQRKCSRKPFPRLRTKMVAFTQSANPMKWKQGHYMETPMRSILQKMEFVLQAFSSHVLPPEGSRVRRLWPG